ncbi:hypothetical protein Hanom_Chr13g01199701 [Helianthus anomalus]
MVAWGGVGGGRWLWLFSSEMVVPAAETVDCTELYGALKCQFNRLRVDINACLILLKMDKQTSNSGDREREMKNECVQGREGIK